MTIPWKKLMNTIPLMHRNLYSGLLCLIICYRACLNINKAVTAKVIEIFKIIVLTKNDVDEHSPEVFSL